MDTSALMAIALGEKEADICIRVLETETEVIIYSSVIEEIARHFRRIIELLGLESRAAAHNYLRVLALAFVAVLALALGYIFVVLGLVFLMHGWTGWSWRS